MGAPEGGYVGLWDKVRNVCAERLNRRLAHTWFRRVEGETESFMRKWYAAEGCSTAK